MVADLTLLEQLGFKPTKLERKVLGNPSFQWLYDYLEKNGWPNIADMAAGNVCQIAWAGPDSNDLQKLAAPSALRKWADEFYGHLVNVLTLVATVRRDYKPIAGKEEYNDPDKRLLTRLQYWLSNVPPNFRWDEFLEDHDEAVRTAEVAKQLTGTAQMVVLLTGRLNQGEQDIVREALLERLQKNGILPAKDDSGYASGLNYHLPAGGCFSCSKSPHDSRRNSLDHKCPVTGAMVLMDYGDAKSLKRLLPRPIQSLIHTAEFTLDRRYLGINIERSTRPVVYLTVITSSLDFRTQNRIRQTILTAAGDLKDSRYDVLAPDSRGLNALVVACEKPHDWDSFTDSGIFAAFDEDKELAAHVRNGNIQVTRFGVYKPKD